MGRVVGGIGISHTPSMGVEYDAALARGGRFDDAWQPWSAGTRRVQALVEALHPDHLVVVYNDHLNYFDLDNYPTMAIGVGESFRQADEGWGRRDLPDVPGDLGWGLHLATHLVDEGFDLTVSQALQIDHGILSWLPYVVAPPWTLTVTPIAINMIREPLPRPWRLRQLGAALRRGVEGRDGRERVLVVATGGMSHQISGSRFGMANLDFDRWFLRSLPTGLDALADLPLSEFARIGGTEAVELTMWLAMRAALSDGAVAAFDFHTFPKITGCGALVMVEPGELNGADPVKTG